MKTWIITADSAISALVQLAADNEKHAIVLGDAPVAGVDSLQRIALGDAPVEAYALEVAQLVKAEAGDIVLVRNGQAERVIAGAVAAKLGAPVVSDVRELGAGELAYGRFGGITIEKMTYPGAVVVLADGGTPVAGEPVAGESLTLNASECTVVESSAAAGGEVNLAAAKRIVSAGRGFGAQEDLDLARNLATALGAELACTRPLAEGNEWLPRDSYVGISGQHVAPEIYFAVGISGQIQHTSGMNHSKYIMAVNKDENAAIFKIADYGIVGDLYEVLPALCAALEA